MRKLKKIAMYLILTCLLFGCAAQQAFREGKTQFDAGHVEEALQKFREASEKDPGNAEYRMTLIRAQERAISNWLEQADNALTNNHEEEAAAWYQRILGIEPYHDRAQAGLALLAERHRHADLMVQAKKAWSTSDASTALANCRAILTENPKHAAAAALQREIEQAQSKSKRTTPLQLGLRKEISLEFKDAALKQVFEILARTSGINFLFDKDVRGEQKTTLFLQGSTVQEAIELILLTNQLEQRTLNNNTILIFPNTPTKLRDYQSLTVKTFLLANADAKNVAKVLKTILKLKNIVVDEKQNMIVMRDTPEAVRLAEKIVAVQDLPEPEVMLEVEVLEVKRTSLVELGIRWPDQLTLAPLAGSSGNITANDLKSLNSRTLGATISPMVLNAKKQDGDANILANPRIRTRNNEAAKILIGERVPNITTTSTSTGFISESVTYVDVGLKLEVQPTIYPNDEVAIKISLEVSNIVSQIQTQSGSLAFQIGTRTASTVLRLRNGENQVLAGLISDEDRNNADKVPGLGDLPLVGRLFSNRRDESTKTEVVLSITPRLVRNVHFPRIEDTEFESGTEVNLKAPTLETLPIVLDTAVKLKPAVVLESVNRPAIKSPPRPFIVPEANEGAVAESVRLHWKGPQKVKAGETFSLAVAGDVKQALSNVSMSLTYDPKKLEFVSAEEGSVPQTSGEGAFNAKNDSNLGKVVTNGGRTSAQDGPSTLVTVYFKAREAAENVGIDVDSVSAVNEDQVDVPIHAPDPHRLTVEQ